MNGLGPFASLYDINFPDIKNPFSAFYYMKENKGRTFLCIFMMVLATFMFLAGNYIHSELYTFEKEFEYSDKIVIAGLQSKDKDFKDFATFKKLIDHLGRLYIYSDTMEGEELYNYVKTLAGDKRVQISESQRNIGFAVCEVLIIVPLILSKGRLMSRADVTEF